MKTLFLFSLVLAPFGLNALSQSNSEDAIEPLNVTIQRDVVYGRKTGMALTMDVIQPMENGNRAGVVFIVSHCWESRYHDPELLYRSSKERTGPLARLAEKGYTVFLPRQSGPPRYKLPDVVNDLQDSIRFIKAESERFEIDETRVGAFGESSGAHLALLLSVTGGVKINPNVDPRIGPTVDAVVAWSGPCDLRTMGWDIDQFPVVQGVNKTTYSPIEYVSAYDAPTLLVHGSIDLTVPIRQSEALFEAMNQSNVPCEFLPLEGSGHAITGDNFSIAVQKTIDWFDQRLLRDSNP